MNVFQIVLGHSLVNVIVCRLENVGSIALDVKIVYNFSMKHCAQFGSKVTENLNTAVAFNTFGLLNGERTVKIIVMLFSRFVREAFDKTLERVQLFLDHLTQRNLLQGP